MPNNLKQMFFIDKSKPNLPKDYDFIGFDLDCLIKYKMNELAQLIIRVFLEELNECLPENYPKEITNFDTQNVSLILNNTVWDISHGNLLKLGNDR